jgi:hypothetical protein
MNDCLFWGKFWFENCTLLRRKKYFFSETMKTMMNVPSPETDTPLLSLAYSVSDNIRSGSCDSYCSTIKYIPDKLDLGNLYSRPDLIDVKSLGSLITRKPQCRFTAWFQGIEVGKQNHGHSEGDKLRTYYVKFKYIFQKESYLNSINNTAERALFTKFRIRV